MRIYKLYFIALIFLWHAVSAQPTYMNNRLHLGVSISSIGASLVSYGKNHSSEQLIILNTSLRYKVTNGFTLTPEYYHYQSHDKQFNVAGTSVDRFQLKILKTRTFTDWFFIESGGAVGYSKSRFIKNYAGTDGFGNTYHYDKKTPVKSLLVTYALSVNFQYKRFTVRVEAEPGMRFGHSLPFENAGYSFDWPFFLFSDIELQYSLFHHKESADYNRVGKRKR